MPTGWTPAAASSTLEEWTRTFSRVQQSSFTEFGRESSLRVESENMENLMTVVDELEELQASSVGRSNKHISLCPRACVVV